MSKTILKIGGIFGGGFGYEYDPTKKYITFKNNKNEELFCLDYWYLPNNTVRVCTYLNSQMHKDDNRICVIGEPHEDFCCHIDELPNFLGEMVANDILNDRGVRCEEDGFKTISYYEEPVRYSVVVAVDGYAVDVTNGILEKDIQNELEHLKGRTTFHIVEGSQIDDKLIGKIWEE